MERSGTMACLIGSTLGGAGFGSCFSTGVGATLGLGGASGGEATGSKVTTSGAEALGGGRKVWNETKRPVAITRKMMVVPATPNSLLLADGT